MINGVVKILSTILQVCLPFICANNQVFRIEINVAVSWRKGGPFKRTYMVDIQNE